MVSLFLGYVHEAAMVLGEAWVEGARIPHDLDEGQLANNPYTRSKKSLRRLEFRIVGGGGMTRAELGDA